MADILKNCAVRAIHAVTGEAPAAIAAAIAAFPAADGGPAFVVDAVKMWSVCHYLESKGWETLLSWDRPLIPWTCVICVQNPDHCFAIVNGQIRDRANVGYDGASIAFILLPPTEVKSAGEIPINRTSRER